MRVGPYTCCVFSPSAVSVAHRDMNLMGCCELFDMHKMKGFSLAPETKNWNSFILCFSLVPTAGACLYLLARASWSNS